MIKRLADIKDELEKLRASGIVRGELTGFSCLDKFYTVKQGSYTTVLGSPTHGKSEFIFELLVNQSVKYGKRHLVYSPETGSVEEIFAELIHKISKLDFYKWKEYGYSESTYQTTVEWIDWHFLIVDSDERAYSIRELFDMVSNYEKDHLNEDKISCIMAEPYNEIKHEMGVTRQDLYIEELIGDVRRFCKKNKKHLFLSIHPADQPLTTVAAGSYYPRPLPRQAAGGQALYRKAMAFITLWRPPTFLEENGIPYQENEVVVTIDKAKPKRVCFKGSCRLYFQWKENRYYEYYLGKQSYAFGHVETVKNNMSLVDKQLPAIPLSTMFNEPVSTQEREFKF